MGAGTGVEGVGDALAALGVTTTCPDCLAAGPACASGDRTGAGTGAERGLLIAGDKGTETEPEVGVRGTPNGASCDHDGKGEISEDKLNPCGEVAAADACL